MKSTKQYFPVVRGTPYYALQGGSNSWIWGWGYCAEQYFAVVLLIMLYKVVLTFESEDEILKCDHSNKRY